MIKLIRLFLVILVLIPLVFTAQSPVSAQDQPEKYKYFPETGHNVTGDFWQFYKSQSNAQQLFGYPITEAYRDSKTGIFIQYFTRARFEFYPEKPSGSRVQLTKIGEALYKPGKALNIAPPLGCRAFPNGFAICYDFLKFFENNGGEAIFGTPISGFEVYNNRIVQYFERARFEWYPEFPEGQKVVLADLGRVYFDNRSENPGLLSVAKPLDNIPDKVISIQARAFAWKTVVLPKDQQYIYVIVQDQTLKPILKAMVKVVIRWADGSTDEVTLVTDQNGVAKHNLTIKEQAYGSFVTVDVSATYLDKSATTVTSFRVWR